MAGQGNPIGKRVPKTGKRVRDTPAPTVRTLTNTPNIQSTCAEDLVQTYSGPTLATSVSSSC